MAQLVVPFRDGWTYQHQVNILLPKTAAFQPNIVLLKERRPESWTTIDVARAERRLTLLERLPRFTLEQSSVVEYLSCPAARLTYTWRDTSLLRQTMLLWLSEQDVYTATFTDLAIQFQDNLPLFEQWLGEIGLQGTPP
jgi:hypothetical protein